MKIKDLAYTKAGFGKADRFLYVRLAKKLQACQDNLGPANYQHHVQFRKLNESPCQTVMVSEKSDVRFRIFISYVVFRKLWTSPVNSRRTISMLANNFCITQWTKQRSLSMTEGPNRFWEVLEDSLCTHHCGQGLKETFQIQPARLTREHSNSWTWFNNRLRSKILTMTGQMKK